MANDPVIAKPLADVANLISRAEKPAGRRFLEFFTINIGNKNTRKAYARAASVFLHWCEAKGTDRLQDVQPMHIAGCLEQLGREMSPLCSSSTSPASACCSTGWSTAK